MTPTEARIARATKRYNAAYAAWQAKATHYDTPEWRRLHNALHRSLLAWEKTVQSSLATPATATLRPSKGTR